MRCRDRNGERDVAPPRLVRREFGDRPDRATQPSGSPMTSNVGCATVDPVFTMSTRTCAGVSGEARISLLYNRVVITASGFWRAASVVYVYRDFRPWALVAANHLRRQRVPRAHELLVSMSMSVAAVPGIALTISDAISVLLPGARATATT